MDLHNVDDYMKLPYTFELVPDEDLGWFASVRELPGCMSDGDTPDHAVSNLREVMYDWMEAALEDVKSIPVPACMQKKTGKFIVRTSPELHQQLTETAQEQGVSTNQLCSTLLASGIAKAHDDAELNGLRTEIRNLAQRLDGLSHTVQGWSIHIQDRLSPPTVVQEIHRVSGRGAEINMASTTMEISYVRNQ